MDNIIIMYTCFIHVLGFGAKKPTVHPWTIVEQGACTFISWFRFLERLDQYLTVVLLVLYSVASNEHQDKVYYAYLLCMIQSIR